MTLLAASPLDEAVPCLRGLDPVKVQAEHDCDLVYLLHLDEPFTVNGYSWQHYFGSVRRGRLAARMVEHRTGASGAKFLQLARDAGITWHLVRVWEAPDGSRYREERRIKNMGGGRRSCYSCGVLTPAQRQLVRTPTGLYAPTRGKAA